MAGIGNYSKGKKFTLKSGNSTSFKMMGSSPMKNGKKKPWEQESSTKEDDIKRQREDNITEIKADKKARYDAKGTAIFERPYEHPGEAVAFIGAAPLSAGTAGLGIPHAATAANFGKTILASQGAVTSAAAAEAVKSKKKKNK
jgi:hypothetical protein